MEENSFNMFKHYSRVLISNNNIIDFLIDLKKHILSLEDNEQDNTMETILKKGLCLKTNEFARNEIKTFINQLSLAKKYLKNNKGIFFKSRSENYKEFSTFYPSYIDIRGNTWKTVEHFYQASKADNMFDVIKIKEIDSPKRVRKYIKEIKTKEEFDLIKNKIMFEGCLAKFKIPKFKKLLLKTSFIPLYSDSKKDSYWGYEGKNMLGKIIEQIRFDLSPISLKILNLG